VVLTIGCDKTTPACLMAAATVNIPAIALSVGPMLNGWHKGERTGSGTIVWKARELLAAGEIDHKEFIRWSPRRRRRPAIATRWAPRRR
jgi:dihydroxy-acid dehydratase